MKKLITSSNTHDSKYMNNILNQIKEEMNNLTNNK